MQLLNFCYQEEIYSMITIPWGVDRPLVRQKRFPPALQELHHARGAAPITIQSTMGLWSRFGIKREIIPKNILERTQTELKLI